jgi:ATP-dependent DNA helicase RecG
MTDVLITLDKVKQMAASGESETLEFKRSTGERREAAQTVCAMLNHRGGRVIFGIEPSGRVTGQTVADQSLQDISGEIQLIEPPVFPVIHRIDVEVGKQLIVVEVAPGTAQPYTYKGAAYKRVGNTSLTLSREEYNRVLIERLHSQRRWENELAEGWTLENLDTAEITRTLEEAIRRGRQDDPGTRNPMEILRGLGLVKADVILRAAVALFGRPQKVATEMTHCLLRVAKFKGTTKSEFLDNKQHRGNIFELLTASERFLIDRLPIAGRIVPGSLVRIDEPLYPPVALREALANAFCHRDYSMGGGAVSVGIYDDRLEITSSGALHFGLTPEALFEPHESRPWNPLIADVLYRRGIIEQWGRGTQKMAELTERAGLPKPTITEVAGSVVVTFFPSQYIPPISIHHDLSVRQRAILKTLSEAKEGMSLASVHQALAGLADLRQVQVDLLALKELKLASFYGKGRGAKWKLL